MKKNLKILIVDDDKYLAKTLKDILIIKGYNAECVFSGAEAIEKVTTNNFDFVLTDIRMPDMTGVELHKRVKEKCPQIPVILITAYSSDDIVKEAIDNGAITVLTKPLDIDLLLEFFSSIRREHTIVIIDDDPEFCNMFIEILKKHDFNVKEVCHQSDIIDKLTTKNKVIFLDIKLGDIDGIDILKKVKKTYPDLPVVMITSYHSDEKDEIKKAVTIGAYSCIYNPFKVDELIDLITGICREEMRKVFKKSSTK